MVSAATGSRSPSVWNPSHFWRTVWPAVRALVSKVRIHRKIHSLRVEETLPLGDRRFLAVVRWGNQTLLVGVTSRNISLLQTSGQDLPPRFASDAERSA